MKTEIKAADRSEEKLFYACDEEEILAAKIGHMRFDFGNGRQFYGTWFGGNETLNDDEFRAEFNEVTKILRSDLLKDRSAMGKFISENPSLDLGSRGNGYKVQTDEHTYYLRCKPQPGDYDCYCFCYERELLEQALSEDIAEEEKIGMEMNT
jgi:hypothetical protein